MRELIVNVKHRLGIMKDSDYQEYRKQCLIRRGLICGDNVDIINSYIDYDYCFLISIGDNVTITGTTILTHDASTKKFIGYTKWGGYILETMFL